ncbi:protein S-acyltransferase 10-like [Canna indica]|uniref:S-acyltransferase n=1 Tax=Canna indica TaxID=4628 RepID=A0AAQ3JRR7_9LILI|nr:protein S-acyltransferase 10-like [Canna indica]
MTSIAGCSTAVREASGRLSEQCLGRFPCLADRATRSSLCLKLILVLLHVTMVGALFLLDGELSRRIRDYRWYAAIYLVLFLATLVQYFFTSCSSPGYVIDAMIIGSETHTNSSSFNQRQTPSRHGNVSSASQMNSSSWLRQVMELYPPGFSSRSWTCGYCHIIQPPRSKHCHDCDKCVLQFDHHCAWLGTCIGKGNHCRFWWYVFEETILCIWTGTLYINLFISKVMKEWWKDFIAVILLVILVFCLIFLILLLFFHSYLALTNQTTHEIMRRRRILYLRYEKNHLFSTGKLQERFIHLVKGFVETCFPSAALVTAFTHWKLYRPWKNWKPEQNHTHAVILFLVGVVDT